MHDKTNDRHLVSEPLDESTKLEWIALALFSVLVATLTVICTRERHWRDVADAIAHQHSGVPLDAEASKDANLRALVEVLGAVFGVAEYGSEPTTPTEVAH